MKEHKFEHHEVIATIMMPDFNDVKDVEKYISSLSQQMIDNGGEECKAVGLWVKNLGIGFTAALADSKRHSLDVGTQLNAFVNACVQLLTPMALCAGSDDAERKLICRGLSEGFIRAFTAMMADALKEPKIAFDYFLEHKKELLKTLADKGDALWVNKPDRTIN